ncbi:MAG: hypothetical protein ACRDIV_24100 [Ktedonobacteraceae bacterium]
MESESKSEVARLMHQIDLELEAAQRGMYGFASSARHDFINARMQRGGERILQLIEQGKHEGAQALMNADNWGMEGQAKDDVTTPDGTTEGGEEEKQEIKKG